jgi:hypothetical protein
MAKRNSKGRAVQTPPWLQLGADFEETAGLLGLRRKLATDPKCSRGTGSAQAGVH